MVLIGMAIRRRGISLLLSLAGMISPAVAQSEYDIPLFLGISLTLQDTLLLILLLVILVNILVFLRKGIFPPTIPKEPSSLVTVTGSFMAILLVGLGSLAAFIALLVLLSSVLQISLFEWMASALVSYTGSLILGVAGLGIVGVGMFLVGAYNLVLLQDTSYWKSLREPDTAECP
jgi:hypothetical protein